MRPHKRRGALELLTRLRAGEIIPQDIGRHERRGCVMYLRLEGYTQEEIAEIFKVSRHTIGRDEKANRREMAKVVDEIDVKAMAGGLITSAKHLFGKALKEKDYALAWRIERELIADLQSMGYVPKSAQQHQVHISTFADLGRLAVEEEQAAIGATIARALPEPGAEQEADDMPAAGADEGAEAPTKSDEDGTEQD